MLVFRCVCVIVKMYFMVVSGFAEYCIEEVFVFGVRHPVTASVVFTC